MSLDKSEVKIGTVHEIGCRLDDVLEAAQKEVSKMEGAAAAFAKAEETAVALCSYVDKDMDEGKLDLEQATLIKQYLTKGQNALNNLRLNAQNQRFIAAGKVQGLEASIGLIKKLKDEEEVKRSVLLSALANRAAAGAAPADDEPGPPRSLKARRLAEEAAPVEGAAVDGEAVKPPKRKSKKRKV